MCRAERETGTSLELKKYSLGSDSQLDLLFRFELSVATHKNFSFFVDSLKFLLFPSESQAQKVRRNGRISLFQCESIGHCGSQPTQLLANSCNSTVSIMLVRQCVLSLFFPEVQLSELINPELCLHYQNKVIVQHNKADNQCNSRDNVGISSSGMYSQIGATWRHLPPTTLS